MLVITRKANETIVINGGSPDEIVVKILGHKCGQIRLGIDAPKTMPVHRGEVQALIERRQRSVDSK
jgi:carbon storage regulator